MPIHAPFLEGEFDRKVGQSDPVFGVPSSFISRSVHARLQVSVYKGLTSKHTDSILTSLHK